MEDKIMKLISKYEEMIKKIEATIVENEWEDGNRFGNVNILESVIEDLKTLLK